MKRILLFLLFTLLLQSAFAQDQIVKRDGSEISARVLEISSQEILYQHPDSLEGKSWRIPKAEVFMIQFANGTKEVFPQNQPANLTAEDTTPTPEEMYQRGRQDAQVLYRGNGAMWGSAASALIFPYGYAGSAIIALSTPKAHNHPVSDPKLLSDPDYVRGYEEKAGGRKALKALTGAGIGTVGAFVAVVIFINAVWR